MKIKKNIDDDDDEDEQCQGMKKEFFYVYEVSKNIIIMIVSDNLVVGYCDEDL